MSRNWIARAVAVVALATLAGAQVKEVHGRVVGPDGEPVAGARFARTWSFPDPADDAGMPKAWGNDDLFQASTSDELGAFRAPAPDDGWLYFIDPTGRLGAMVQTSALLSEPGPEVRLEPLVEVRGSFQVHAIGAAPETTAFWAGRIGGLGLGSQAVCFSRSNAFSVRLPPGRYLTLSSSDAVDLFKAGQLLEQPLVLEAGQEVADLGSQDMHVPAVGRPTGVVLDSEGEPVGNASLATTWSAGEYGMIPFSGFRTGEDGRFQGKLELHRKSPVLLIAYDARRTQAGAARWDPEHPTELEIRLKPTVRVHGSFVGEDGERPSWTNVYVSTEPDGEESRGTRLLSCQSTEASFDFRLPPGTYAFNGYGTSTLDVNRTLEIGADDLDLGTIELPRTIVAANVGKPALPWTLSDARGISKDATLADFRGKWVVLEFWGYW